jgi:hypothetical protein
MPIFEVRCWYSTAVKVASLDMPRRASPFSAKTRDFGGYIAIDHHGCSHDSMMLREPHRDAL